VTQVFVSELALLEKRIWNIIFVHVWVENSITISVTCALDSKHWKMCFKHIEGWIDKN